MLTARRSLLLGALATAAARAAPAAPRAEPAFATVTPRPLEFPRDHGAHPDYRIEWWYLTGWLEAQPQPLGFQVTFFRSRTPIDPANPSRFAAHQLLIAHAALADPARGALLHDQRIARAGFSVAAEERDTDVRLDGWRFARAADGRYEAAITAGSFELAFEATPTQPLLLQGEAGFSRKGPRAEQASHYYTQPQLAVRARLVRDGRSASHAGRAWLDHEWSSTVLDPDAAGWDWVGMNLDDGAALTAFQIRRKGAGSPLYAYAALRQSGAAAVQLVAPAAVRFETLATWRSPRTGATYPIAQRLHVGSRHFDTQPLLPDQELDSRATSGTVYWEGASRLLEDGKPVGRGYLELTGYVAPLTL